MKLKPITKTLYLAIALCITQGTSIAKPLKAHSIFSSNMVIQRDKPILIWGWANTGDTVTVSLGEDKADAKASGDDGRWEVKFPPREANAQPQKLLITSGDHKIEMENIVVGDVWVMNGQSNMAWSLGKTIDGDLESLQSDIPLLRLYSISPNEHYELQKDIRAEALPDGGWVVSSPETASNFSAIGFSFASRIQRTLGIPIGVIKNARGGASLESLVPKHKFKEHPLTKRYVDHVEQRRAEYDQNEQLAKMIQKWEKKVADLRKKNTPENKLPKKPTINDIRSWSIPGKSPSDAGSCYNGMFGVFKGYNIKGVLFHQGYNNAIGSNCRPKRYRLMMKLMVEGWREDFNDPELPVGVIGFCAGGISQDDENFEIWSRSTASYIREAQRLGLADVNDPENTAFLPAFDYKIPGLHPFKKKEHGIRAARWALNRIYEKPVQWHTAKLVSAHPTGDEMVLTFDKKVYPHDHSLIPKGFSIAGKDGKFYRAHARFKITKDVGIWTTSPKGADATTIHVWSPLVTEPAAVRYGWASSAMGNLYVEGKQWAPLPSFRTDKWDWPEDEDPAVSLVGRSEQREKLEDAQQRNTERLQREAEMAIEISKRLKTLGRDKSEPEK